MIDSPNPVENQLQQAGQDLIYPPTPDIAAQVLAQIDHTRPIRDSRRRRFAWVTGIIVLVLLVLMAVPPVRAQILEFLQFGAIRIFLSTPTPSPTLVPTQTLIPSSSTPAPTITPTPLPSLLDLSGATTLEKAQQGVNFSILLPTYPADIGLPAKVYLQNLGGPTVILVWLQPGDPSQVRMSLIAFGPGSFAGKYVPEQVTSTTVNGKDAMWLQGNHFLILRKSDSSTGNVELMVNANVLLWMDGEITYRLETSLPIDKARQVAESLKPYKTP